MIKVDFKDWIGAGELYELVFKEEENDKIQIFKVKNGSF